MEQKRFVSFIVLSMAILVGWKVVIEPRLPWVANAKPAAQKPADKKPANDKDGQPIPPANGDAREAEVAQGPADEKEPAAKPAAVDPIAEKDATAPAEKPVVEKPAVELPPAKKLPAFPAKTVELGSTDPESKFRQLATLTSQGAAVEKIELNDPRYKALPKPHPPLAIIGSDEVQPYTLSMTVPQLDKLDANLSRLNWELVEVIPANPPHTEAKFRLTIDNLEIVKHYTLGQIDTAVKGREEASAYELYVDLSFHNLSDKSQIINYVLQGPTGLPLENVDNTQKFRDVVVGFLPGPGAVEHTMMAGKVVAEGKPEVWQTPFEYIGVDVQYFAALLSPKVDQRETRYVRSATQTVIGIPQAERSEVSVELTSVDLDLEASGDKGGQDTVTHSYKLFAGPKRDDVLPPGAAKVVDFGMFHWISRPMLALLKAFHWLFGSWGVAVICLTIIVRSALFPLSIKQARGAAKMQELQPEIAALKEKYGKDKEKMARAQMELFSKHKYNPLAGCLPVFLQLPIFMGLYQALNNAVDLRMAKFLYIQNLAAPDALFQFPFVLPFLGWKEFNLLPLITIALFIVQQKMFMPPPQNEEQAMQQKMMNFMMLFMGVMFYKVPAGLCVYFIASSTWGMAERKLLPKAKPVTAPAGDSAGGSGGAGGFGSGPGGPRRPQGNDDSNGDEGNGFFAKILKAADKQTSARKTPQAKRK